MGQFPSGSFSLGLEGLGRYAEPPHVDRTSCIGIACDSAPAPDTYYHHHVQGVNRNRMKAM